MKYVKKPIIIEAIQWDGMNGNDVVDFCCDARLKNNDNGLTLSIPTLEGDMIANWNDWIIKGINCEFYPCKPDIFEKTYSVYDEYTAPENKSEDDKFQQATDNFKMYLNKIFKTIDDNIHNKLWNHLGDVIVAKSHTAPIENKDEKQIDIWYDVIKGIGAICDDKDLKFILTKFNISRKLNL